MYQKYIVKDMILFEDEQIIVCHKPAGLAVQNAGVGSQDLECLLRNYLAGNSLYVVHRLDQPVEGILVFAKTKESAADLSRQFQGKIACKEYMAVTENQPPKSEGDLRDYLKKDSRNNLSYVVPKETPQAKLSDLHYRVIFRDEMGYHIHITLGTGRHHQIRVQMAHAGMPLVGDRKYNSRSYPPGTFLALCAAELSFIHPATHKRVKYTLENNEEWLKKQ